jgi:hypothetical protein
MMSFGSSVSLGGEMDPYLPYQTELVKIADRLASQSGDADEATYLRRFRVIYRHLAASVMALSIESGMSAMAMGGMMPGMQQSNVAELLQKTDEELGSL